MVRSLRERMEDTVTQVAQQTASTLEDRDGFVETVVVDRELHGATL